MRNNKIIVDGHCDTLSMALYDNSNLLNTDYSFNLEYANTIKPYIQTLASFINPSKIKSNNSGYTIVNNMLDKYYEEYNLYKDYMVNITSKVDITKVINENKVGILLSIENGDAINGSLRNLTSLHNRGISMMSLTWNNDNKLACGSHTLNDTGLTELGIKVVKKMNELNMIIDVSHASQRSFYDIIYNSNSPVIASHSCVNSICNSPRNLTDEQIKQIAKKDGVIGICFYTDFLNNFAKTNSDDIIKHIVYIANLVGVDYVALGSDFDGMEKDELPTDIYNVCDLFIIFDKLKKQGFSDSDIYKIAGENYIRVFNNILK